MGGCTPCQRGGHDTIVINNLSPPPVTFVNKKSYQHLTVDNLIRYCHFVMWLSLPSGTIRVNDVCPHLKLSTSRKS